MTAEISTMRLDIGDIQAPAAGFFPKPRETLTPNPEPPLKTNPKR